MMKIRPMYCRGSTSASRACRAKTCATDAAPPAVTVRGGSERSAVSFEPAASRATRSRRSDDSQPSSTAVTCASEVVSLETRSSTASAGLASCDSAAPTDAKCAAISLRGPQYATRPPESTSTL